MADDDYRRLAAACACGVPVKGWLGVGRKPTRCEDCCRPKRKIVRFAKACEQCGVLMPPATEKMQKRFCSVACVGLSQRKVPEVECLHCGKRFSRRLGGAEVKQGRTAPTFCSMACRSGFAEAKRDERRQERRREVALAKLARRIAALARSKEPPSEEVCTCARCGVRFVRVFRQRRDRCDACSAAISQELRKLHRKSARKTANGKARRLADKARRRARQRIHSEPVDPFQIFERDRWRCRICGVPTPRELRGSYEDRAPELDHVISLAEGGPHVASNLQCACRACNLRKGSRSLGQLWLGL